MMVEDWMREFEGSGPAEIRRGCRQALLSTQADQQLACVQFLTRMASTSASRYQIFVQSDGVETQSLLHLLVHRLGATSADLRTHILSCLNAFDMPEYLVPAFLASLENMGGEWQVRLQAILALQSLQNFNAQQKQILQAALRTTLESDSSDLVKQAAKQTLALWEEFAAYYSEEREAEALPGDGSFGMQQPPASGGLFRTSSDPRGINLNGYNHATHSAASLNGNLHQVHTQNQSAMLPVDHHDLQRFGSAPHQMTSINQNKLSPVMNSRANNVGPSATTGGGGALGQAAGVNASFTSTQLDSSFDFEGSNDSLRSAFAASAGRQQHTNQQHELQNLQGAGTSQSSSSTFNSGANSAGLRPFLIPEDFIERLRTPDTAAVMQLLEDVHQLILGGSPIGFDCVSCACVSLADPYVLKKFVDAILQIPHFKVTLTTFYIIGDLVAPDLATAMQSPGRRELKENGLKIVPRIIPRIFEKLGDAKFVIRQTASKLITKILGAMLSGLQVASSHSATTSTAELEQMAHLIFEEFETSTSNGAKCEALLTILTGFVLSYASSRSSYAGVNSRNGNRAPRTDHDPHAFLLPELVANKLQKWFDKTKDERVGVLLGEGIAVCLRECRNKQVLQSAREYNHTNPFCLHILRTQVAKERDLPLPHLNDQEGTVEYAPEIQATLEGSSSATFPPASAAQHNHYNIGYDIFGTRKMPAPILKSSRSEDDRLSCVSGSTTSRARSRVTFSEPGDEQFTKGGAKSSSSSTCGGSSSGASSSSSNSSSGINHLGVDPWSAGDRTNAGMKMNGFLQHHTGTPNPSNKYRGSPAKLGRGGATRTGMGTTTTSSLAEEVHNYLSSDFGFTAANNQSHYSSGGFGALHHGGSNGGPAGAVSSSTSYQGALIHNMSATNLGGSSGIVGGSGAPGGGGVVPTLASGASTTSGATTSMSQHPPPFHHSTGNSMQHHHNAVAASHLQHHHHQPPSRTLSLPTTSSATSIASAPSSGTTAVPVEYDHSIKDRLRLLKARVRTDHRGMLRSEGSMQPSAKNSTMMVEQRSVMSAGEPIPWGLGVISLSKIDSWKDISNSNLARSRSDHMGAGNTFAGNFRNSSHVHTVVVPSGRGQARRI